jgi:hypothetical protein
MSRLVREARHDGIDVALETRSFRWRPADLYYAPGQSAATTKRVPIFAHDGTPPRLSSGGPEHIEYGWDTRLDGDGSHEDFTYVQGVLHMQALGTSTKLVRRSIRELIALIQGIAGTGRHDSGIARDNTVDRFTTTDIAAMKQMSGCAGRAPA